MKIPLTRLTLIRTTQLDDLHIAVAALRDEKAGLEEELVEVKKKAAEKDPGMPGTPAPPTVVRDLIRVADGLVDLIEGGAADDPGRAATALGWVHGRAEELLASIDVKRIDDAGPVDLLKHEVVDTRPAPAGHLVDQIAETVRPGYSWDGSLIRPQQVVAYIPAEEMRER